VGWRRLESAWEEAAAGRPSALFAGATAPAWRMFLLSDGSVTRHLEVLLGEAVAVDLIAMTPLGGSDDGAPAEIELIAAPRLRRQVWLVSESGRRWAYASSWWADADAEDHLGDRGVPIWTSLATARTETFRDLRGVRHGRSPELEAAFEEEGPLWGRHYLLWHDAAPLTLIYEVFSPALARRLT
jgi:chorismate lyase